MSLKRKLQVKTLKKENLTLMDAVNNLSALAELDIASSEEGIEEKHSVKWLSSSLASENQEEVKETFRVLQKYLEHVYKEERSRLKDPETQKGIQAIMVLAGEAASKVDKFTDIFQDIKGKGSVTQLKEFQDLQKFYLTRIIKRFQETLEQEEEWQAEWGENNEDILDIERRGLKDLETVRRDREYELFYLRKENGRLFFNRNLLRHIRLVGDFDEAVSVVEEGDPILKVKILEDRMIYRSAREILNSLAPFLDAFYKDSVHYKSKKFVTQLNKAIMALMLAGNARNSLQTTTGKSCLLYFCDFHTFLREALLSDDYQMFLMTSHEELDPFYYSLMNLSHVLCTHFFMRIIDPSECIDFIYKFMGVEKQETQELGSDSFFTKLLDDDERLRAVFNKYPNGPILKTLDVLKIKEDERAFDPLSQDNFPFLLFNFKFNSQHVTCLHLPCPVYQVLINKVQIVEEFRGFIRALSKDMSGKKLLMINLQDRTSWQERARCTALEMMQKEAEFANSLCVVSLPKNTDFYFQTSSYLKLENATDFKIQLLAQVQSGPDCGFFFPQRLDQKEIVEFSQKAIEDIHKNFFSKNNILSRTSRLDFIEIFYHLLTCKFIEWVEPDALSFTSKDGIDSGAATASGFFLFLRLFSDASKWKKEERDRIIAMLYLPALVVRERAINLQCFNRTVSAISFIDAELKKGRQSILKAFNVNFNHINLMKEEREKS